MSDSVYSYNLLPNPKPTDTSAWKFYSQSAGIDLQHGCRFIRTAPVGAHAHERDERDHAIQTPIGYRLESLVSRLNIATRLGVVA